MANSSFSDPKCCLESLFEEYNDQTMDEYDESDSTTESRRLSFKNVTTSDIPKPDGQHKTNTDSSNRSQLFTPQVLKKTIKLKPLAEITNKQAAKPNESMLMNSFEEDELNTSFLSCESTLPSPPTLPLLSSSQGDSSIPIANHNRSQSCSSSFYSALFSSPITKTPLKLKSPPHINYYHPTRVICDELTDAQILKRRNKRNYGYKSFFTPGVTFSNDINESVSEPSSTSSQEYRPRGKARKFITQDHWTEFQDISKDIFGSR